MTSLLPCKVARNGSSSICPGSSIQSIRSFPARRARNIRTAGNVRMQKETTSSIDIKTESMGEDNTFSYRLLFKKASGDPLSPWHDIPLYPTGDKNVVTFVNEIPRGEQAKMEIALDEEYNPIKQDIKKGELRFYKYGPSLVNYGAMPQTWEDPGNLNPDLNVSGDGDPLDVTEIGSKVMPFGAVYPVKVLGTLALLDEGEVDWKVIAINVDDPAASQVNNIDDVENVMPGRIAEIRDWFRYYKTAEGKGENEYGYNGEAQDLDVTLEVIEETHQSWKDLRSGKIANEDGLFLK